MKVPFLDVKSQLAPIRSEVDAAVRGIFDETSFILREGVACFEEAFAGYTALPASPSDWWIVLGIDREATAAQIEDAFREKARKAHPDVGGSHVEMSRLNSARDVALEERRR